MSNMSLEKLNKKTGDIITENDFLKVDNNTYKIQNEINNITTEITTARGGELDLNTKLNKLLADAESKTFVIAYIYNSSTDCTSDLQKLIDYAYNNGYNHVIFEFGTYSVKDLALYSNTVYEGQGNVVFKIINSAPLWSTSIKMSSISNVILTNIDFDGNKENVVGTTEEGIINLRIENSRNIIIDKCNFYNNHYCNIYNVNVDTIEIKNNTFKSSDVGTSFLLIPSKNISIHDCIFDGIDGTSEGISLYDCTDKSTYHQNAKIYNNIISNKIYSFGIRLAQTKNVEVYNNKLIGNQTGVGVLLPVGNSTFICDKIDIHNNKFEDSLNADIYYENLTNSYIRSNKSQNANKQFMKSYNSSNIFVNNNDVLNYNTSNNSYGCGIELSYCNNFYISKNTLISKNLYKSLIISSPSDDLKSSDIYIFNNTFLPLTSANSTEGFDFNLIRTANIYMFNNMANIGTLANNATFKGNTGLKTATRVAVISSSYGKIFPYDDEVLYFTTTSSTLITNCTIGSVNLGYSGKKLTLKSLTNLVQFVASSTLTFKNNVSTYTPVVEEVLNFIHDGTKWMQI